MDWKYNKGWNIKITTSIRKDQKRHIPNETKNVVLTNIDKISVIWIDDIIDEPISKFTEKIKDIIINAIKYNKLYSI